MNLKKNLIKAEFDDEIEKVRKIATEAAKKCDMNYDQLVKFEKTLTEIKSTPTPVQTTVPDSTVTLNDKDDEYDENLPEVKWCQMPFKIRNLYARFQTFIEQVQAQQELSCAKMDQEVAKMNKEVSDEMTKHFAYTEDKIHKCIQNHADHLEHFKDKYEVKGAAKDVWNDLQKLSREIEDKFETVRNEIIDNSSNTVDLVRDEFKKDLEDRMKEMEAAEELRIQQVLCSVNFSAF